MSRKRNRLQEFKSDFLFLAERGRLTHSSLSTYLEKGGKINTKDAKNNTALILAMWGKHKAVAALLIKAGADTFARDQHGKNALDYAKQNGWQDIIALIATSRRRAA